MRYRVSFRSNPRLLILVLIMLVLAAAAVALLVAFGVIAGIISLLIAGYLVYHLTKFVQLQLRSYIDIADSGVTCRTSAGEDLEYHWDEITHSGILTEPGGKKWVYLYDENKDRLLTIPDNFENRDELATELGTHVRLDSASLGIGETVQDRLKRLVGPAQTVIETEDSSDDVDEDADPERSEDSD